MPDPRPRLYLIDGYSNIFRAFYAIRNLSSSKGLPTNAVYGFIQMLRKLLREENPDHVGIALDVSERTFRSERFEDYKANRRPMPEDLVPQIPWIRRAIAAFKIPILELASFEADDVLGTLARKAADQGYDVVLVSADKDLAQLVEVHVSLYHTGRDKLYDPALVEEDFGVPPAQLPDVLALKGDAVDNVPGVPGIGDKGARQLVREFGSVEELLERAEEVSRKSYRESLQTNVEKALLSKELVTIRTDLPLDIDPEALHHDPPDVAALREIASELEFFTLLDELEPAAADIAPSEPAFEVTAAEEWNRRTFGWSGDLTLLLIGDATPVGLAVGGEEGRGLWADFRRPGLRDAVVARLEEWLGEGGRALRGHDLKEVLRLCSREAAVAARLVDVMLLSYLVRPEIHGHTLEELSLERFGASPRTLAEAGWQASEPPALGTDGPAAIAGERLALVERLVPPLLDELGEGALAAVYEEIEAPLVPVLVGMEEAGILLDVPFLTEMSGALGEELASLERDIHQVAGEEFNINSPQQLGIILFEKLGYPVLKRTRKTKSYSTGAEVLEELANRGFPLPDLLLRYRELAKLKSTYVDALPALVAPDGRLHTRFQQAVAATGRLSSVQPNLQNIPVRTELGQRIRRAFVAPPGRVLLAADYSQIELRVLAHITGEGALVEAFRSGRDIHRATAASVFGVAPEAVTGEQRRAAKTINFGIIYGMSPFGLAQNLKIPTEEAARFIAGYFAQYPAVERYVDETLETAERDGKVETLYGRIRWLPDIASKNWNLRENSRRMAINARIQGSAADLLKRAMIALDRRLRSQRPEARLLLTVHDELVLEVPEETVEEVAGVVREEMVGVADLRVPLEVDTGWGASWYEAKSD